MSTTTSTDATQQLVQQFGEFLRSYYHDEILELAAEYPSRRTLLVDWMDLYQYDHAIADDFLEQPERLSEYADEALRLYDVPTGVDLEDATVRFSNLQSTTDITSLGKEQFNDHLLNVRGQVTRVSKIRQEAEEIAFECERCGSLSYIPQSGDALQAPHECQGCERQGPFSPNHDKSNYRNHQLVRIQKPPEGGDGAGQKIDVSLTDDQVTSISDRGSGRYFEAGDKLSLNVIQSVTTGDDDTRLFETNYDAHSYTVEDTTFEDLDIEEYEDDIRAIATGERGDPFDLLVESIAPGHYGDEEIKLAIALQLFGGWAKEYPDDSRDRGDIHVLLLGDPGSGKSSLLRVANNIVPRSVYASGKGASAAGMTASAVQDDFGTGSEWTLKAGAMVQADQGLACVDEIDKMDEDAVSSMHEALESQRVKVNKAGINAELNARASLLAAGNPKYGRFDEYEPIGEQIDLDPPLMSRFDLMFMVTDSPDAEQDAKVVDHQLRSATAAGDYTKDGEIPDDLADTVEPAIELETLQAYIGYAQQNVYPQIRDDAVRQKIQEFFVGLRTSADDQDSSPVPVTFRKVEAIQRLAEASARVRLDDEITIEDVERATRLVQSSMRDVGYDPESGQFDADIIETGHSASQRDRIKSIKSLIEELDDETARGAPVEDVIDRTDDLDIAAGKVEHEIEQLKDKGEAYETGDGHVRLT